MQRQESHEQLFLNGAMDGVINGEILSNDIAGGATNSVVTGVVAEAVVGGVTAAAEAVVDLSFVNRTTDDVVAGTTLLMENVIPKIIIEEVGTVCTLESVEVGGVLQSNFSPKQDANEGSGPKQQSSNISNDVEKEFDQSSLTALVSEIEDILKVYACFKLKDAIPVEDHAAFYYCLLINIFNELVDRYNPSWETNESADVTLVIPADNLKSSKYRRLLFSKNLRPVFSEMQHLVDYKQSDEVDGICNFRCKFCTFGKVGPNRTTYMDGIYSDHAHTHVSEHYSNLPEFNGLFKTKLLIALPHRVEKESHISKFWEGFYKWIYEN